MNNFDSKLTAVQVGFLALALVLIGYVVATGMSADIDHDDIHYHAGFTIILNGELQDYSGLEFMHISPCNLDEHEDEHDLTEVTDRVHLHDFFGTVVHVHDEGVTWRNLFQSLGIESALEEGSVYIYPLEAGDTIDTVIGDNDLRIISIGEELDAEEVPELMPKQEDIIAAEAKLESCGS